MEGYSAMEEYSEGFPARATATPVSSAAGSRNTTEIPAGHVPRNQHESSGSGRSSAGYSAGNINVPDYRGSGTLGYAPHLSDVPTSGYATDSARFAHHLPPTSSVSPYEPSSYAFHSGGYPLQPRQELSYGQQSYIGQSQQSSLRTDSETYNAALALVQSQSKMYPDASGGQFYQVDSGTANSSSYEVVHSNLVNNSSQNVSIGPDRDHSGKIGYVSGKTQTQISQDSDTVVVSDGKAPGSVEGGSEGHVEVVVEAIELVDATNKSDTLQEDTLVLLKADSAVEENFSQLPSSNPLSDISSKALTTKGTLLDKKIDVDENQEDVTKTLYMIDKAYKDTASQVDGPDLESRFGVLREEFKEFRGSKACCIKLKPVKKSYLDISCNNIVFDIEIDNELIVSSIEKTYLTEKTSNYSFRISNHEDYYPKSTSKTMENDSASMTAKPTKATYDKELLTENTTVKFVKEQPKIKIEKEEPTDKIMTRASKRKMAKPLKKTVLKQPYVGKSKDTRSSVEVKVSTKHDKISKSSKSAKESQSSKKEKESKSPKKETESKKKKSKSKSKSSKEQIQTDTDLEEAADRSDDYNSTAENTAEMEIDDEKIRKDTDLVRKEMTVEVKSEITDEKNNVSADDSSEKVIIKQKKKRKKETEEKGDVKPKRVYQKRKDFSQTELNYSVRKSENGWLCLECGHETVQFANYLRHRRVHTGEKPFKCEICSKCFACSSALNYHKTVHQPDRNYPCQDCQFAFKTYCEFKKHVRRVHQRQRSSTCHLCGESFASNFDLKTHLLRHSGARPFGCETCGKAFVRKSSLVRHKEIHEGVVRYQCHLCGKGFNRSDTYKAHLKSNHGDEAEAFYLENRSLSKAEGHEYYSSRVADPAAGSFHIPEGRGSSRRKPLWPTQTADKEEEIHAIESVLKENQSIETQDVMDGFAIQSEQLQELGECTIEPGEEFVTVHIVGESGDAQIMMCPINK